MTLRAALRTDLRDFLFGGVAFLTVCFFGWAIFFDFLAGFFFVASLDFDSGRVRGEAGFRTDMAFLRFIPGVARFICDVR